MSDKQIRYVDLFAGCAGLSLGLHNAGLVGLFAIEKNSDAFKTLRYNLIDKVNHFSLWPEWLEKKNHDIIELLDNHKEDILSLKGSIDLVVGGPPCQGFSMAGKRDPKDIRNKLVDYYIEFIKLSEPTYVLFENVKGLTTSIKRKGKNTKTYKDYVVKKFEDLGYNVESKMISMNNYGVPQKRERFILIGSKKGKTNFFNKLDDNFNSFINSKGIKPVNTIKDALSDLKRSNGEIQSPDTKSFKAGKYGRKSSGYQKLMRAKTTLKHPDSHRFANQTPVIVKLQQEMIDKCPKGVRITPNNNYVDNLKRRGATILNPKGLSPTITSNPDGLIHYNEPRIPTVREMARLQSFPDHYEFKGKYTTGGKLRKVDVPRYTQIGNAVPPLFAEQAGLIFKEIIGDEQ
jgi:DNA (cytosine-5)-methyltransferase 1